MAEEYVVFIVESDWVTSQVTEEQWTSVMTEHRAFADAVAAAGALGGDALQQVSQAVRIDSARSGRAAVFTDGPFGEMREVVTGYYKIEVKDANQAHELAALFPSGGHIEVFPVINTGLM